jgi:predicted nucleotidyltransferase
MKVLKTLLNGEERQELLVALRGLGLHLVFVAETGSKAWGTSTKNSDHDFTVVAHDVDYDIYRYPRESFTQKITFKGQECDVRVFSVAKFLRKLQKSVLVGYEAINSPFIYYGSDRTCDTFQRVSESCFDPREMYRSTVGSMSSVKHESEAKRRRQLFRYMFIALQLKDYADQRGPMYPVVNIEQYFRLSLPIMSEQQTIGRLNQWAHAETPTERENDNARFIMDMLYETQYPKLVEHKQDAHREFLSAAFYDLMSNTKP